MVVDGSRLEEARVIGKELVGRYRVEEKIGEGGMGEVYLVKHIHMASVDRSKAAS